MPRTPTLLLLAALCCAHADGTVRHVLVLEGLPHGMTEECVNTARGIRRAAVQTGVRAPV